MHGADFWRSRKWYLIFIEISLEPAQRNNSKLFEREKVYVSFGHKRKTWSWDWRVRCGLCEGDMMIQPDGNTTCKFDKVFNRPNSVGNIGDS